MSRIIVRCELLDGSVKFRVFENADFACDHATLCRAFALDPIRTSFDLPSTARGVGSASGDQRGRNTIVNGLILWPVPNARDETDREPIGTLTFVRESEVIPDVDPFDRRDFFNLNRRLR